MIHELKTWPIYFTAVKEGRKTFEVRKNDRDYNVGDELLLREFSPKSHLGEEKYSGRICHRKISYILYGGDFGIDKDTVILGLQII